MSEGSKKIGNVEKKHEETRVEWKIPDFFSVVQEKSLVYKSLDFLFADASWYLQIEFSIVEDMFLYLCNDMRREYSVEFNHGVRKVDGTVEVLGKGIMQGNELSDFDHYELLELSELQQRKSELVPSGVLTVICTLKRGSTDSDQANASDKPSFIKLIRTDTLSENLKCLFSNKESCDVTLHVMDKEYQVHKAVLIARSSVFAAMFQHPMSEKQTGIINIQDCDPDSFEAFLEFLYSGKLEDVSFCSALHLYETSNKYNVEELKEFCRGYLMENLAVENACDAVILADKYDDTQLITSAQKFFNESHNEVFQTTEWERLMKNNYRLANKLLKGMRKRKLHNELRSLNLF